MTLMIHGDVTDLVAKQSLTAKIIEANRPKIDISKLPIKDAIKLGSGTRRLYVFSDPDCPYCKQLERDLNQLQNTQIFIFPMPLISLHQNSRVVSESIWCQSNHEKAWRDYMDSGLTPKNSTCDNPISRNLALAERLQIQGTPAIIFEDGTLVPGAIPLAQINDKLKGMAKK
jgi:thiol:disulfide interchange protein DsbC